MNEFPAWLVATLASDAAGQGVLPNSILPLRSGAHVVGPAFVALMSRDDNLAVRQAIAAGATPGTVLVVAGGSESRTATVGGLMALELQQAGFVALVTDGLVRDSQEIRASGLAVWCRGVTPTASQKAGPAQIGGVVAIGGVVIHDGDWVIADDDGVVIWPQADIPDLLQRAEARLQQDTARLARLQATHRAEIHDQLSSN